MIEKAPPPDAAPIVTQVSRWDPLKDHAGVMEAFCHVPADLGAHLILAGPAPDGICDDPGSEAVLADLHDAWLGLDRDQQERIHLACLPMADVEENAAVVNALQRRSDIVVQKSLAEGFGLTVAEAMWKAKPTIGSRVGGIQDQIAHGQSGVLTDADDLPGLGDAITALLRAPDNAARIGRAAHERVRDEYLAPCYLARYLRLIESVLDAA
jgi:trehalose synthase